jgi:hypothetical protein
VINEQSDHAPPVLCVKIVDGTGSPL